MQFAGASAKSKLDETAARSEEGGGEEDGGLGCVTRKPSK